MDILDFYKGLLKAGGITVDENGYCINTLAGLSQPITISGKKLALPTEEILNSNQWDKVVGFHPASESVIRGESLVLRKLRKSFQNRLNHILLSIFEHSIAIAASTDDHEKLSPDQSALLRVLANVDEKSIASIRKVNNALDMESPDNKYVNLYIKKEGMVAGKSFKRATIVTFPIYRAMEVTEPVIFGVNVRQKDKKAFLALMDYVLPKSTEAGAYDSGSHDLNVPALDSLVQAVAEIFVKLNDFVLLYKDVIPESDTLVTDLWWYDGMENIAKYRAQIPALDGNQGIAHRNEQDNKPAANANTFALKDKEPTVTQQPTNSAAPVYQPQPQQHQNTDGPKKLTYAEYANARNTEMHGGQLPPPPPPGYHPNQPPYGYAPIQQQAPYGAPGYPNVHPSHQQPPYHPGVSYQGSNAGVGMGPGRADAVARAYSGYQQYPQQYGNPHSQQGGYNYGYQQPVHPTSRF